MAGWYCADCGGEILLGSSGELGLKIVCVHCDIEMEVTSVDPPEVDWARDWDWEEERASVQEAFPHNVQVEQVGGVRGRLVLQSLSGSMPWE
jgi:lysine biosynthesis protein LysW